MKKLFVLLLLVAGLSFISRTALAGCTYNPEDGICSCVDDPDCYNGATCEVANCSGGHANVCCVPGNSDPLCSGKPTWTYAHDAQCTVDFVDDMSLYCSWYWKYQECPATDSCKGQTGLRPGLCTDSGCAIGASIYKTCCNAYGQAVACSGGDYTGVCTPNQTVWGTGVDRDCTGGGMPAPTTPPSGPGCSGDWGHSCSEWNNNASGCWSNGQFSGEPSCRYCSDTNTCACGSCPTQDPWPTSPPPCNWPRPTAACNSRVDMPCCQCGCAGYSNHNASLTLKTCAVSCQAGVTSPILQIDWVTNGDGSGHWSKINQIRVNWGDGTISTVTKQANGDPLTYGSGTISVTKSAPYQTAGSKDEVIVHGALG